VFPSPTLLAHHAPLVPVAGCPAIVAHQAPDVFALWSEWERESRRPREVPYWATVWPAARVLAAWIFAHPDEARGKPVLEVGCGGAVAPIASTKAGAMHVVANDIDPVALHVARLNAAANGVAIECDGNDLLAPRASLAVVAGLVLVADLFYQKELAARTVSFLASVRAVGARVIVADGGRQFAPREGVRVLGRERVAVDRGLEGVEEREVAILEVE